MSERKPSLNAGPRIRGNTYNTVNLGGRNTVISGPNYDANAGTEIIGDAFGVLNFNEQNDARCIEEFTQRQAGRTQSQSTEDSFQINGYVKIFNQGFDRPGSERDVANLIETFRRRGVEPVVTLNSKYEEISSEIDSLSKFDFSTYKLFVCIVMSHGHTNGRLCAADREFIVEPTIVEPIMKNKSLNGIPKIFIIVACRGSERYVKCDTVKCTLKMDEMDREIDGLIDGHFSGAAGIVPYLISYSTLEGLVSYRTAEAGTFFIQSFCNNINKATGETDINSVFTNVNQELASEYQIQAPEFKTTMGNIRFKDLEAKPN